jgi:hypothetical protein
MVNYTPIQLDLLEAVSLLFNNDFIEFNEFKRLRENIKKNTKN